MASATSAISVWPPTSTCTSLPRSAAIPICTNHRRVREWLHRQKDGGWDPLANATLGAECSAREQDATNAEREGTRVKGLRLLAGRLGDRASGSISGLVPRGLFVELRDPAWFLVGQLARSVNWFNPLAWYAVNRLHLECERACDDHVLRMGVDASEYAGHLLELSTSFRTASGTGALALAMASKQACLNIKQNCLESAGSAWTSFWVGLVDRKKYQKVWTQTRSGRRLSRNRGECSLES